PIEDPSAAERPRLERRVLESELTQPIPRPLGRRLVSRRSGQSRTKPIDDRRVDLLRARAVRPLVADAREIGGLRLEAGGQREAAEDGERRGPRHCPSRIFLIFASRSYAKRSMSRRYSSSIASSAAGSNVVRRFSRWRI